MIRNLAHVLAGVVSVALVLVGTALLSLPAALIVTGVGVGWLTRASVLASVEAQR